MSFFLHHWRAPRSRRLSMHGGDARAAADVYLARHTHGVAA
ncbi:MAG TPA: hypothetical protein VF533_13025 [Solirubrobacteraceae bacterium]|jgi:hypothetical protein